MIDLSKMVWMAQVSNRSDLVRPVPVVSFIRLGAIQQRVDSTDPRPVLPNITLLHKRSYLESGPTQFDISRFCTVPVFGVGLWGRVFRGVFAF
jgi:hypothetical protein